MTALFAGQRKDRTWLLGLTGLSGANWEIVVKRF